MEELKNKVLELKADGLTLKTILQIVKELYKQR